MAGYSGTPLPQKLGIKENFRIMLVGMPAEVRAELKQSLAKCKVVHDGPLDFAMVFAKSQEKLKHQFPEIAKQLAPAGMVWICWPKKSSGVTTDVTEKDVHKIGLDTGLVDVKVCAVNEVWSGFKFVIRVKDRLK